MSDNEKMQVGDRVEVEGRANSPILSVPGKFYPGMITRLTGDDVAVLLDEAVPFGRRQTLLREFLFRRERVRPPRAALETT